jgi:hypothetical protein
VIKGPPQVVGLAIDPHEDFTEVPAPARKASMSDVSLSDLSKSCEAQSRKAVRAVSCEPVGKRKRY